TEIVLAHDVVAVEHRASLVAGDGHCDALGHAGANEVPRSGAAEVMHELRRHHHGMPLRVANGCAFGIEFLPGEACLHARREPGLAEVDDRAAGAMEDDLGDAVRLAVLAPHGPGGPSPIDQRFDVALEGEGASAAVLRMLRS